MVSLTWIMLSTFLVSWFNISEGNHILLRKWDKPRSYRTDTDQDLKCGAVDPIHSGESRIWWVPKRQMCSPLNSEVLLRGVPSCVKMRKRGHYGPVLSETQKCDKCSILALTRVPVWSPDSFLKRSNHHIFMQMASCDRGNEGLLSIHLQEPLDLKMASALPTSAILSLWWTV